VRGLEATLSCCEVVASRPRSYHLSTLGALCACGLVVWIGVLQLTRDPERRGQRVRLRPASALFGAWGAARRRRVGGKEY
jgi:hypothetical protein